MTEGFLTPEQVKDLVSGAVADAIKAVNTPDPAQRPGGTSDAVKTAPNVNLNRPQRPSLARAIFAMRTGRWQGAELERDIVQATAAKYLPEAGPSSVVVPSSAEAYAGVLEDAAIKTQGSDAIGQYAVKALSEGTNSVSYGNTTGAALVPVQFLQDEFVLALLSTVALRSIPEVRTIPVNSNIVLLPRESTQATTSSAAEAGTLNSADPAFATQSFTIQKQYGYRTFSNELLNDSNPAIDRYIARTLARDVALFQDSQYLEGSGSGSNLTGIRNYSNLTTSSFAPANGAAIGADDLINAVFDIRKANAEMTSWIMHPRTLQGIAKLKDASGRYLFNEFGNYGGPAVLPNPGTTFTYPGTARGMLLGYPVYLSTQVLTNETKGTGTNLSHVIYGDFRYCAILERQALELAVSEHVAFNTDQTAVRAIARSAIALTQPTAFAVATGCQ